MVRRPLVSPPTLTTAEARLLLRDEHLHAVLVLDGPILLAVVERADLDPQADPDVAARHLGRVDGRVVAPDVDLVAARTQLVAAGRRRLAVVDEQNRLLGLLCLKRSGLGFCSDADADARAAQRAGAAQTG